LGDGIPGGAGEHEVSMLEGRMTEQGKSRYDLSRVVTSGETDVGKVRTTNQDAFGEFRPGRGDCCVLFVADGMGGHRGGEVASQLAVESVGETLERSDGTPPEALVDAIETANRTVFEKSCDDLELAGMGTTGVALVLTGERGAFVAHVGDSRAYRMRGDCFELLTADHSVVGELVRRGQLTPEEARVHPQSNEILRAIGTQPDVEVELTPVEARPGDRFLLCSDGLSGMLPDARIGEVLGREAPGAAVRKLIDLANEAGGTDNITVQIAEIPENADLTDDEAKSQAKEAATDAAKASATPGGEAAAAGSWVRWAVALLLAGTLALLLLAGPNSGG
jgi:protein phosphatase